jgi:hypothetical protein
MSSDKVLYVNPETGNVQVNGVGNMNGVKFPNTKIASSDPNTLDDYQEGTWIPLIGGAAGTKAAAAGNYGWYTKIGRQVSCGGSLVWNSTDVLSGNIVIKNLPFSSANTVGGRGGGSIGAVESGLTVSSTVYTNFNLVVDPGQQFAYIAQNNPSGAYSLTPTISNGGSIYGFTMSYIT